MFGNTYSSCFGRNILTDPNFDFSRLSPLIVGLYAAGILRLVFNLQNYASKISYLFNHILSQRNKEQGKKHKYQGYLDYRVIVQVWASSLAAASCDGEHCRL